MSPTRSRSPNEPLFVDQLHTVRDTSSVVNTSSQSTFAGRAQCVNTGGAGVLTMTKTIANTTVTANSVILLTCERDTTSFAGIEYMVNLSLNGRSAGVSFSVDIKRQLNANISTTEGCTINYLIIN